jgi:hypothetical protein
MSRTTGPKTEWETIDEPWNPSLTVLPHSAGWLALT